MRQGQEPPGDNRNARKHLWTVRRVPNGCQALEPSFNPVAASLLRGTVSPRARIRSRTGCWWRRGRSARGWRRVGGGADRATCRRPTACLAPRISALSWRTSSLRQPRTSLARAWRAAAYRATPQPSREVLLDRGRGERAAELLDVGRHHQRLELGEGSSAGEVPRWREPLSSGPAAENVRPPDRPRVLSVFSRHAGHAGPSPAWSSRRAHRRRPGARSSSGPHRPSPRLCKRGLGRWWR
jgi:hypothetical protein